MVCGLCGKELKVTDALTIGNTERSLLCRSCYEKTLSESAVEDETTEQIEAEHVHVPSKSDLTQEIFRSSPQSLPNAGLDPALVPQKNIYQINNLLFNVICFLSCLSITAIISFYIAFPVVRMFVFGGQQSAWGLEYLLCIFAPLPGVIGFSVSWLLLIHKSKGYERGLLSAVIGVAVACIAIVLFYQGIRYTGSIKARDEAKFFQDAIQGKHSEVEIKNYYKDHPIPNLTRFERTSGTISPKAIELLISIFDSNPSLQGFLAAQPETTTECKLKVAESPDIQAVLPMAINTATPSGVLIKLSSHKSIEISRAVNSNRNAPLAARYIYSIRSIVDEKERYVDSNRLHPPGLEDPVGKSVWESLASDKRESVRLWVAKSYAPQDILQSMANDPSQEVLKWLFLNPCTPLETLTPIAKQFKTNQNDLMKRFSKDPDNFVRRAVTQTPATSNKILVKLMSDQDETVSGWASNELERRGYTFNYPEKHPIFKRLP